MRASRSTKRLITIPKKFFAGGGATKKIDPNLKDFDVIFVGGLNSALILKHFQQKHFHGTMAAFNHSSKFSYEHLYDYIISGNMKIFKYSAMPFTSLVDISQSRVMKDSITHINPAKNQITSSKGEVFNYKTLVLNTGLNQKAECNPILAPYVNDGDYGKSNVQKVTQVPSIRLDTFFKENNIVPDAIFMDVQEAELEVLKSASSLLKNVKFIVTEVATNPTYKGGCDIVDIHTFLEKEGFELIRHPISCIERTKYYTYKDLVYKNKMK